MLGNRPRSIYGAQDFMEYLDALKIRYKDKLSIEYWQSNIEGEIITAIQNAATSKSYDGIVINAAGYTHTSVGIADAVEIAAELGLECVEVHISNISARESFRHTSLLTPKCSGCITGFGLESYRLALEYYVAKK